MSIVADGISPLKGSRIVVADRHAHNRTALREMVSSLGATSVSHAQSAAEVLRAVKARDVNIILCDYHLEDQRDGQQLLEELRHDRVIPLGSVFMMITGENSYKKVVAVAEFAPDDYLIKPFTANQLLDRLVRVSRKKEVFGRAYALIEGGRGLAALPECRAVLAAHPEYSAEAYRLMVDVLLGEKCFDEAEKLLEVILSRKLLPWAYMGLANIHYARSDLEKAETILTSLAAANPEYLGAQDFLAKIKAELEKPKEALEILEAAGAISSANVNRLRRTGDLAAATGDFEKSGRLYARVMDRVRNSAMARAEDFMALSESYLRQGRLEEAEKVSADQRRTMRGSPEAELVSRLMEFQRFSRDSAGPTGGRAKEALVAAANAFRQLQTPISGPLEYDLVDACFKAGCDEDSATIAEHLLARNDVPESVIARLKTQLATRKAKQARMPAIVSLDQAIAMLGKLNTQGWNDALGDACQASIAYWAEKDPGAELLTAARTRLAEVSRKYGMGSRQLATIAS